MITFIASFWEWNCNKSIKIIALLDGMYHNFIYEIFSGILLHTNKDKVIPTISVKIMKCIRHFINHYDMVHDVWTDEITIKL
jgi:hypothetical protein